jgi:flagellar capping protein FliD
VTLTTSQSTATANVYVGRSLVDSLNNYLAIILSSETGYGDIDTKIETFEEDFKEYNLKLEKLEEDMVAKRALYQQKFSAMDQAIAGFKETQTFLTNMMAGWASNN